VKRLLTFLVLSLFFINCIGYQLYIFTIEKNTCQNSFHGTNPNDSRQIALNSSKNSTSQFSFFAKDIDSDDLLEFTAGQNYSANEIFLTFSSDILPDRASKGNQYTSFKCFNGEYFSRPDKLFTKYPDHFFGKVPDRYLFKIPVIFLSAKDHPPQRLA
jgi:hypothetical protein